MQKMPAAFRQHLGQSLLGRLKLKLFEQICESGEHLPNAQQVRHYIAAQYRSNAEVGKLFMLLLNLNRTQSTSLIKLQEPDNLGRMLAELEETPLDEPFFLEIADCPEHVVATSSRLGVRQHSPAVRRARSRATASSSASAASTHSIAGPTACDSGAAGSR